MNQIERFYSMEMRLLQADEVRSVYYTHLVNSFPRSEVKPLENILRMMEQGRYECLGIFEKKELCGYAYMVVDQESGYLLLDYLAVVSDRRSCGYGSRILKELRDWYQDRNGIFIESEALRTSANADELVVRRRRLDFYEKNGCELTCVKTDVYGVEYSIFYIPILAKQPDHEAELDHIYRTMFSEKAYANHVRAWHRSLRLRFARRWSDKAGDFVECASVMDALGFTEDQVPRIIALVGGGGKTSTMFQLADELAECGKKVLVTTTTHFNSLRPGETAEITNSAEITPELWAGRSILTVGRPVGKGKLAMPEGLDQEKEVARLLSLCDVILVEADGAARRPLKVPRAGEPVFLPGTGAVIACAGLSCVGMSFADKCFRFETEGAWLKRSAEDPIKPEDIARILSDARGGKKNVQTLTVGGKPCEFRILLNQADDATRLEYARRAAKSLPEGLREACMVTNYLR
jgi:probable selenium-dependent hydroxylase accessory protein YqeC